ncbi:addiction module toxin, HicA family protein [Spirochaetia bacterium]|nr:addiction module toxin, HicA family protein [Spirochaetia bacterium]
MADDYGKKARKKLSENGCYLVRHGKGDHDVWFSPITNRPVTVDGEIPSRHMANAIMKQAGINYHF